MYTLLCRAIQPLLGQQKGPWKARQDRRERFYRMGLPRIYFDADLYRMRHDHANWRNEWKKHDFLFIHIPKNGGHVIRAALDFDISHEPAIGFYFSDPEFFSRAWKFAISRNPYDRLVSGFHFLKHNPKTDNDRSWSNRYLKGIDNFSAFLDRLNDRTFESIVMSRFHFMPQTYFVCDWRNQILIDYVVQLESISSDIKTVNERTGLCINTGLKINASARSDWRTYYNNESAKLVQKLYFDDFRIFGYPMEIDQSGQ